MSDLMAGPCMQALTAKQQLFVLAMASDPNGTRTDWARAAGYSDVGKSAAVIGHHLMADPKIQAAALEVARGCMRTVGPHIAFNALSEIARDRDHKDRAKAAIALADRSGMAPVQKVEVDHRHTDLTGNALLEKIRELADRHGIDYAKLVGTNAIEGEYEVVGVQTGNIPSGPGPVGLLGKGENHVREGGDAGDGQGPSSD